MLPSRGEILKLYKALLRYGDTICFTDKNYYKIRIREEFKKSKAASSNQSLLYEVKFYWRGKALSECLFDVKSNLQLFISSDGYTSELKIKFLLIKPSQILKTVKALRIIERRKTSLDKSKIPQLNEKDLEEQFIKGSGPGGSKVNKSINCVFLVHKPTGLHVKVHEHRELHLNRNLARKKLITLLDNLQNGENSIENQKKKLASQSFVKKAYKQKKLLEMKEKWKASLTALDKKTS